MSGDSTSSISPHERRMMGIQAASQLPTACISIQFSKREIQQQGLKHFENKGLGEDSGKMLE